MIKKLLLLLLPVSIIMAAPNLSNVDICLNDGSKCYYNITIMRKLSSDQFLYFQYFNKITNKLEAEKIHSKYTILPKSELSDYDPNRSINK